MNGSGPDTTAGGSVCDRVHLVYTVVLGHKKLNTSVFGRVSHSNKARQNGETIPNDDDTIGGVVFCEAN